MISFYFEIFHSQYYIRIIFFYLKYLDSKMNTFNAELFKIVERHRRQLPPELLNEIYALLPLENAFRLLATMPNGLLARNDRRMLNQIRKAIKNNRWNLLDSSPKLFIYDDALGVINNGLLRGEHSVRAEMPIRLINFGKRRYIAAYFEVKILHKEYGSWGIGIGFCGSEFPLTGKGIPMIGKWKNTIGIYDEEGIYVDLKYNKFGRPPSTKYGVFAVGSVVGCGLIYSGANGKMEYFATYNGQLLGSIELPAKFLNLQLFPALSFFYKKDSIRANFGAEDWLYDPAQIKNDEEK